MSQAIAAAKLFQARDLFVHDGSHLRRLRLSAPVQMAMLIAVVVMMTWSAYSAFRLFLVPTHLAAAPAAVSSDIARLAAATEARASAGRRIAPPATQPKLQPISMQGPMRGTARTANPSIETEPLRKRFSASINDKSSPSIHAE